MRTSGRGGLGLLMFVPVVALVAAVVVIAGGPSAALRTLSLELTRLGRLMLDWVSRIL